jgi:hypothetical protein
VLTKPNNLAAQCTNGGNTVVLQWDAVTNAENFYLRVDYTLNNSGDDWLVDGRDYVVDAYRATSFSASVVPGQAYVWWVHPANSIAGIGLSAKSSFTCAGQ